MFTETSFNRAYSPSALVEFKTTSQRFGQRPVIHNLSFKIHNGEIIGVFGEYGSGKAAVINLISGDARVPSVRVLFNGEDITHLPVETRSQRGISRCVPNRSLVPDFTVLETILLHSGANNQPLFSRQGGQTYDEAAKTLLRFVGLEASANKRIAALSAAERYFLRIAMGLNGNPSLLLIDNLCSDYQTTQLHIVSLLMRIAGSGTSVLFTARHLYPSVKICDRIVVLHDGEIVASGMPSQAANDPLIVTTSSNCN